MTLADTSAWVEYIRGTGGAVHLRLAELAAGRASLAVTEPVVMEVLAGARTPGQEAELERLLAQFDLLPFVPWADFAAAATLYRRCRASGITPRGLVDCMIAAVASRYDAEILAYDIDMARIAAVAGLRMDAASLAP